MKYIDFLVKKVLSESLNEKAEEITKKINNKAKVEEGECVEGDCGEVKEVGFKQGLAKAAKKKFGKKLPKSLEDKFHLSDFTDEDDDMTDIMSGEFDYVEEGECVEGNCMESEIDEAELDEKLFGNQHKLDKNNNGRLDADDFKKLRAKKGEQKEGLHGNQKKIDVAAPKGKITAADFAKLRKGKSKVEESIKYSISVAGDEVVLSENELIEMIENIVLEEKTKGNLKSQGKSKAIADFDKIHKKDEDINKKANEESFKKMKDYVKAGSKGSFETNPKHFPKGNGQLAKMNKKAYTPSEAVDEYIDTFAYGGGMLDLDPDEIGYNEDWLEKTIEGSSMTGNSPEYANAEDTGYGKKLNKRRKENLYNQEKRQGSYKRVKQPVDVAGENTKSGKLNKMFKNLGESTESKEVLSEEMIRMKEMIGYNKKTQ